MFNFRKVLKNKEPPKRANPIVIEKGSNGSIDTVLMIGDYVRLYDLDPLNSLFRVTDISKSYASDRLKGLIIASYGESQKNNWDYASLKNSDDENIRALVAANGYYLHELLYDESPLVLSAVLNRLIGNYRDDQVRNFARSLKNLYMKTPKERKFKGRCLFCGLYFEND